MHLLILISIFPFFKTTGLYFGDKFDHKPISFPYLNSALFLKVQNVDNIELYDPKNSQITFHTMINNDNLLMIPTSRLILGTYIMKLKHDGSKKRFEIKYLECDRGPPCQSHWLTNYTFKLGDYMCVRTKNSTGHEVTGPIRRRLKPETCPMFITNVSTRAICMEEGSALPNLCEAMWHFEKSNKILMEAVNGGDCKMVDKLLNDFLEMSFSDDGGGGCNFEKERLFYDAVYDFNNYKRQPFLCVRCQLPSIDGFKGFNLTDYRITVAEQKPNGQNVVIFNNSCGDLNRLVIPLTSTKEQFRQVIVFVLRIYNMQSNAMYRLRFILSPSKFYAEPVIKQDSDCALKCNMDMEHISNTLGMHVAFRTTAQNKTILSREEVLQVKEPNSYICEVKIYNKICPLYDDEKFTYHSVSETFHVTKECLNGGFLSSFVFYGILVGVVLLSVVIVICVVYCRRNRNEVVESDDARSFRSPPPKI